MLRDTILADSDLTTLYNAGSDASLLAALNAVDIPVRVTTLRSTRWLMLNFPTVIDQDTGATEADLILGTDWKYDVQRTLTGGEVVTDITGDAIVSRDNA